MAYDDGEDLQPNSTYSLGGYTFELKVQKVHEPGEPDVVSVFAICRSPDGTRETVPMDFQDGTKVNSWSIEANETEASVYVKADVPEPGTPRYTTPADDSSLTYKYTGKTFTFQEIAVGTQLYGTLYNPYLDVWRTYTLKSASAKVFAYRYVTDDGRYSHVLLSSSEPFTIHYRGPDRSGPGSPITERDEIVTAFDAPSLPDKNAEITTGEPVNSAYAYPDMVKFGNGDYIVTESDEILVARFAIDLREADGGPDGDWDEPGDTGDPSYTLNVYVTGASSGSNSGVPLEPGQTGGYGNGGTGGNGGGGGAGASTVIIYDFATDKAGTVNQEATAQGPGSGGPGGKGGKGGDGCILIFY